MQTCQLCGRKFADNAALRHHYVYDVKSTTVSGPDDAAARPRHFLSGSGGPFRDE